MFPILNNKAVKTITMTYLSAFPLDYDIETNDFLLADFFSIENYLYNATFCPS